VLDAVRHGGPQYLCDSRGCRLAHYLRPPPRPIRTALGGSVKETTRTALLQAEVEGHPISTHAMVVDEIGRDEDGRPIEILFGALAMQQWGIRPIPDEERLDLSHYPEEFVEF